MFFHISNIPFKKHHSGSRLTEFWKLARANCNLHSCSNFALVLHEIAFVFSQSINLLHLLPIKTKVKDPEIYTFDIYYKDQAAVGLDKQRLIEFLSMLTPKVELQPSAQLSSHSVSLILLPYPLCNIHLCLFLLFSEPGWLSRLGKSVANWSFWLAHICLCRWCCRYCPMICQIFVFSWTLFINLFI